MRLIDADEFNKKEVLEKLRTAEFDDEIKDAVEKIPTAYDVDKVIEKLKTELSLADKEKGRCARENPLQFDMAKGYAQGISVSLEIVKPGGVADD